MGVQTDCYGSLLIPILLKKLPEDLRCIIFRANCTAYSSLNDLRRAICQELETRENSQSTRNTNQSVSTTDNIFVPTAGTLLTHSQHKSPPPQKPPNMYNKPDLKPCIYCDSKHRHNNCHIVKTTNQRKKILNNCLRSGHTKYQCCSIGRQESSLQNSKDVRPALTTIATTTTTHTNALLQTAVVTASGPRQARILIKIQDHRKHLLHKT